MSLEVVKTTLQVAASVILPNGIGALGGAITRKQIDTWYKDIKKPTWTPPNIVFPIVWPTLYTGMGVASYLVWKNGGGFSGDAKTALSIYGANLVLNGIWTPLYFGLHRIDLALIDILALNVAIVGCIVTFQPISKVASYLMIPYLAWTCYATALTFSIWKMNRNTISSEKEEDE